MWIDIYYRIDISRRADVFCCLVVHCCCSSMPTSAEVRLLIPLLHEKPSGGLPSIIRLIILFRPGLGVHGEGIWQKLLARENPITPGVLELYCQSTAFKRWTFSRHFPFGHEWKKIPVMEFLCYAKSCMILLLHCIHLLPSCLKLRVQTNVIQQGFIRQSHGETSLSISHKNKRRL